jgi:hypothetical protein
MVVIRDLKEQNSWCYGSECKTMQKVQLKHLANHTKGKTASRYF